MNAGGNCFLTQNWHVSRVAQHIVERKCLSADRDHQLQSSGELLAVCTRWRCEQNRVERVSNFDINIVLTGRAILTGRASFGRALLVWSYCHDRSCLIFGLLLARTRGCQLRDGSNQNQAQERRNAKLSDVHFVDFFSGELSCPRQLWTPARRSLLLVTEVRKKTDRTDRFQNRSAEVGYRGSGNITAMPEILKFKAPFR